MAHKTIITSILVTIFWSLIISLSLYVSIHQEYRNAENLAVTVARANLDKDKAIRQWVSKRGGLYARINDVTEASPHLAHIPFRDIQTPVGEMTLLNPAYMLRLIMDEYDSLYGIKGRIVGLKVLRPENIADEWEGRAIGKFQADGKLREYFEISDINGEKYLRMMTPMYMEPDCMKCHAVLGFQVGDLRGGVNISVPLNDYYAIANKESIHQAFSHGGIWLIGLFGIGFVTKRSVHNQLIQDKNYHELEITEKAIRDGDKYFRALFDQSSFGVAKLNSTTGKFIKVNKRYCDLVGYTANEILEMDFMEITVAEDLQSDLDNMDRMRAGEISTFQMEKRYRRRDGSIIWVKLTALPLWHQDKEPDFHLAIIEDITTQKEIGTALQESEKVLERAQAIAQIGHWKLNPATGEVVGSNELFRIFGISRDEATLETFIEVVHPDDREMDVAAIQRGVEYGEGWDIEHRLICRDGTEKWVHAIGEANTDEEGNVVQLVGTVQDITKLKEAGKALLESELWMKNIYNSLDEAVLVVSPHRVLVNVNNAAIEMFGYSADEISKNSTEIFHVNHQHFVEFGELINQAFSKGQTAKFEFKAKRKSGEIFPTEHTVSLLKDAAGDVKGIVSVVKDITERKQADRELKQLTDRLKLATGAAQIGIWDWDIKKDMLTWDDRMFELYGVKKEEFSGAYEAWLAGLHPDDREFASHTIELALKNEKSYNIKFRVCWPDGSIHFIKAEGQVFWDKDGQPVRMLGVNHDITEGELAEQSLLQSEARLNEAQHLARVGVWELDLLTGELVWSDEIFRIFEIEKDKFHPTYAGFLSVIHPEDRDMVDKAYADSLVDKKPYEITHRLQMSNGDIKYVHEKCNSYFDVDGKAVRSVGTVHEITERKKTEEELARVQGMLEQANRIAKMGAWSFDLITKELVWNDITKEIHEVEAGFKPDIVTAINFYKKGVHRDRINRIVMEAVQKGGSWDEELIIVTAEGNEKWVRAMGKPEFHDDVCVRLYGSFQDISQRKFAEEEFERIFELSPDMVGTGNLDGYFTRINSSFGRVLGYGDEEFMGKPFIEFVHEDDIEKTVLALKRAIIGTSNLYIDNRYKCKNGSFKWIEWYVLAVAQENRFYATGRDVTERKESEFELQKYRHQLEALVEDRTMELMKSLAEKEVLLKEVHHRVKNNMAMVSAFINLQMKQVNEESSLGALKACENRIQAMSMVHKRLYQSSDFTSIDMKILFNEISGALYKKSELADIEVSIETNGISLEMDTAIPCALIVNELFSNSLKYAFRNKQPGKIDIHMDEVANELYRIRISDNGVGFTKSIRLETADTLGLQLVNVFVGQLSGEVKIYGECGIAFEIVFPVGKKTSV